MLNEFGAERKVSANPIAPVAVWEPSSARGSYTWAAGWTELGGPLNLHGPSYVSAWDPGARRWNARSLLNMPGGFPAVDLYLSWDPVRQRFVYALLEPIFWTVYYGYSLNSSGTSWTTPAPVGVFQGVSGQFNWDYPSIAVDSIGRVAIGAVKINTAIVPAVADGFHVAVSANGEVGGFVSTTRVSAPGGESGASSRVIAAGNIFHAFLPKLTAQGFLLEWVRRLDSPDGLTWTDQGILVYTNTPDDNSASEVACPPEKNPPDDSCKPVFFAGNLLQAYGDASGRWSVVFPFKNGNRNNVYICTYDRGCGLVNQTTALDQFLPATTITPDGSYWVTYLTSTPQSTPQGYTVSNWISQSIRFPPGQAGRGSTLSAGLAPVSWILHRQRCTGGCYAAGDYALMATASDGTALVPTLHQSLDRNDLFQYFVRDNSGTFYAPYSKGERMSAAGITPGSGFRPNFVPYPVGADLRYLGQPAPPEAWAANPADRNRAAAAPPRP